MHRQDLHTALKMLEDQGLRRRRRTLESPQGAHVLVDGKPYIAFASNDYLGLAGHPELIEATQKAVLEWGVGGGASHLVSGHFGAHDKLEDALARFVGQDDTLLFSNGYMANLGTVTALVGRGDAIFADKLNHASLNDACVLSRAEFRRFQHNDISALARLLETTPARTKLIVADAVYSMDGDVAPIREMVALSDRHDAWLLLDDAHGFGVLGPNGRGSLLANDVRSPRAIYMATLGKAAGVAGAFVAGNAELIEWLVQRARTYIYTTAQPPMLAATLLKSLELIEREEWRRERLHEVINQLKAGLSGLPWSLMPSDTPIQPLVIGDNGDALRVTEALRDMGLWVPAIRPPTVPPGTARLRISLSAAHVSEDIDKLCAALQQLAR
ncbi:8-amino-7-oxononanoate synthase [Chitinivorax sp. B]|uniref:8-amino-7-oxononanoate synthase n=1 Tax=Chitinivorax sp. B TaxID=2502235 RepID=UPI0010F6B724|nr:8-amino-7-oxononanoate synthase [Chitinivorax sp. B]